MVDRFVADNLNSIVQPPNLRFCPPILKDIVNPHPFGIGANGKHIFPGMGFEFVVIDERDAAFWETQDNPLNVRVCQAMARSRSIRSPPPQGTISTSSPTSPSDATTESQIRKARRSALRSTIEACADCALPG